MGLGRISAICRDCKRPNDRRGLLCSACKVAADRAGWRKQDARERARQKEAASQAQSFEPDVVPSEKIHRWMANAII